MDYADFTDYESTDPKEVIVTSGNDGSTANVELTPNWLRRSAVDKGDSIPFKLRNFELVYRLDDMSDYAPVQYGSPLFHPDDARFIYYALTKLQDLGLL